MYNHHGGVTPQSSLLPPATAVKLWPISYFILTLDLSLKSILTFDFLEKFVLMTVYHNHYLCVRIATLYRAVVVNHYLLIDPTGNLYWNVVGKHYL